MSAGALDRRLQFRRDLGTVGPLGKAEDWQDLGAPVWGSRRDIGDREKAAAGTIFAETSARFQIRASAFARGIRPADRLLCDGLLWEVLGLKEIGRGDRIEITASARRDG